VRFELQPPRRRRRGPLEPDALYDARITRDGVVPSRGSNWHDFLNAIVWATFPRAKRALHARQHRAISKRIEPGASRLPPARTRELDALAILDEGGVLSLIDDAGAVVQTITFGHAMYEAFVCDGLTLSSPRCALLHGAPSSASLQERLVWADEALKTLLETDGSFLDPASMPHVPHRPTDAG
jgi:hypothetical protein